MKRIVLTLCVFIVLSSLADAASFYKCVDSRGNVIMTDNPPPDAKCERGGEDSASTPRRDRLQEINERIQEIKKINRNLTPSEEKQLLDELLNMKAELKQIQDGQTSRKSGCEIVNFSQYETNVGVGNAIFAKTCADFTIRNNDNVERTITDAGLVAVTKKHGRVKPKAGFMIKIKPGGTSQSTVCFGRRFHITELECEF